MSIIETTVGLGFVGLVIAAGFYFAPKGWRTVVVNGAMAGLTVLGAVLTFLVGFDWKQILPPEYVPWAILAVNVLNIALRAATTTPVGQKAS